MSTVPFNRAQRLPADLASKLPHNYEAEHSLLGAILIENAGLKKAAEVLNAADFYSPASTSLSNNGRIFLAMLQLADEKKPIEILTLVDHIRATNEMAAYIASLADGVPRATNVAHYAKIVREKSVARQLIYKLNAIESRIFDGEAISEILAAVGATARELSPANESKLVAVDMQDFLTMKLSPLEFIIEPILSLKGRGMIYAPRGAGKTFVTMQVAYAVATGLQCFVWNIPKPRPVLYVDGEMHASELQDRQARLAVLNGSVFPDKGFLRLVTRDLQKDLRPKINTKEGRDRIEGQLSPGDLLILDNLSALSPSSDEKETEDWAITEDWLSELSWHGVSTIFVNHSGKSGDQRGTSKREDLLDFVLKMMVPSDHRPELGLLAYLMLSKLRRKAEKPAWAQPFEVSIGLGEDGKQEWLQRPLRALLRDRARQMLADGMKPHDVVLETGLSRWTVIRLANNRKNPNACPEDDD